MTLSKGFLGFWNRIKYTGLRDLMPEDEVRRVILSNQVYVAALLVCLFFTTIFPFFEAYEAAFLTGIGALTMLLVFYLNHTGRALLSRKISLYIPTALYTAGGVFYGESLGFQYGYLTLLLIPLLYFKKKWDFIPFYLWCFLNIFISLYAFTFHGPIIGAIEETFLLRVVVYFNNVFLILIIIFTFYSVSTFYQKKNEDLVEKLKEKNNELEQFVYIASHDMKEPIRTIGAYSNLVENRIEKYEDEDLNQFVHFIREGASRMNNLLTDLLEFSRVGKQNINLDMIDMNSLMNDVTENLRLSIIESNTSIDIKELPILYANYTLLIQLFQNIIGNSIKYRKKDTPLKINIKALLVDNLWRFSVRDNGIGMSEDNLKKAFRPFYKVHNRAEYEGSGIGLATCKKICQSLNAKIWMESELGLGSTTYIEFKPAKSLKNAVDASSVLLSHTALTEAER